MGLRLAPLGTAVRLLVLLLPPETAKALHQELWPQERQQVTMPGPLEPPSAPGGGGPGEVQHQPAGVWRRAASATKSSETAGSPCELPGPWG